MRQEQNSLLQMRQEAAGAAEPAAEAMAAWTLVDYLFPVNRTPIRYGSVSDEQGMVLAKTA